MMPRPSFFALFRQSAALCAAGLMAFAPAAGATGISGLNVQPFGGSHASPVRAIIAPLDGGLPLSGARDGQSAGLLAYAGTFAEVDPCGDSFVRNIGTPADDLPPTARERVKLSHVLANRAAPGRDAENGALIFPDAPETYVWRIAHRSSPGSQARRASEGVDTQSAPAGGAVPAATRGIIGNEIGTTCPTPIFGDIARGLFPAAFAATATAPRAALTGNAPGTGPRGGFFGAGVGGSGGNGGGVGDATPFETTLTGDIPPVPLPLGLWLFLTALGSLPLLARPRATA